MICPVCNAENSDDARFCENCGHIFNNSTNSFDYGDKYNQNYVEYKQKKNNTGLIVAITVVSAIAVIAVCLCIYFLAFNNKNENSVLSDTSTSETTTITEVTTTTFSETTTQRETTTVSRIVPNITGMYKDSAIDMLRNNGIKYRLDYEYSSTYEKDYVFSQSPSSGAFMSDNQIVTVYISRGELPVSTDYILPYSDIEYISESELVGMDKRTSELALNEIYARHGRKFNDSSIQSYFNEKSWYDGFIEPEDFSDSVFNKYETKNIATIDSYMKKKGYR
ncbi:MAG: YARHG domain-containing protein [Ruminococcus sp.]|nr:YARHG domain-containing protein [Ruminococcus sp.]MDD6709296.1 YARHG domain-containing protein [Ruminococcus sp.]